MNAPDPSSPAPLSDAETAVPDLRVGVLEPLPSTVATAELPVLYTGGFDREHAIAEILRTSPETTIARMQRIARDWTLAYAPNTIRSWRADWRIWLDYCRRVDVSPLPVTTDVLRAFLLDRIAAGRKRATLEHYIATLAAFHRFIGLPSPLDSMEARLMWRALRREHLVARQTQAKGLLREDVETVIAALSTEHARDIRDSALMSVAFETMCRRSELVALKVTDLHFETNGSGRVLVARGKTDQEGEGKKLYLSPLTVERVQRWLAVAALTEGPLFRSVPHTKAPSYGKPLSDRDVARILQRRVGQAGLDATGISGHSTRVGAAQSMLKANIETPRIMEQGRWKSERMIVRYTENLRAEDSAMAELTRRPLRKPE